MKILLVADEKGWIFDRHCSEIKKRAVDHKIDIAYRNQDIKLMSKDYDLVYVLDPIQLRSGYPPQDKTIMGLRCEYLYREHQRGAKGLYEEGFRGRCASIKDKCSIFHVVNENLYRTFKDVVIDKPLLLVGHGVDENIFDKARYEDRLPDKVMVTTSGRGSTNKGFNMVVKACKEAGVEFSTAQYGSSKRSKGDMPNFYLGNSVHVCMSATEGLNNPLMEAGAMGLAPISTRCGASTEMIRDGHSGLIIDRNVGSLVRALERLKEKSFRSKMASNYYQEIMSNWTWKSKIKDYENMFNTFEKLKEKK